MKFNNILETIGNTPVVKFNRLFDLKHTVWIKLEKSNPGGSIKDRTALGMIEDAEKRGLISPSTTVIIEPTSGNTGIGLAMIAAVKGYRLILVMPESNSIERRNLMASYGAELVLTPKEVGMKGAISKAVELANQTPKSWIPSQFDNPANVLIHRQKTALELEQDFPQGFDLLITGVGTGGHISGCGQYLKTKFPKLKVLAVEPEKSAVISKGEHSPHKIQGIGAGFIPANLDLSILDGTVKVSEEQAFKYASLSAKLEGIHLGISSGATLAAISQTLNSLPPSSEPLTVVGFCYDTGERYLSVEGLYEAK